MLESNRPKMPARNELQIENLEKLYPFPAIAGQSDATSDINIEASPLTNIRKTAIGLAAFAVDASCQLIALAAAFHLVPRFIGKPIYTPLVRRMNTGGE